MNRRQFLRTSALSATALALYTHRTLAAVASGNPKSAIQNPKSAKPNLLFIMVDQMRWDTLACYGNNRIHAPTLNKLAADSVVYDNANVSHPVCTPSRGCMMTGLWPHQSGVVCNNISLPQNIPCYPELINDPDYRTAHIGKWHLGDELFAQHGFQEWVGTEDQYQGYFSSDKDPQTKSPYWHYLHDELGLTPDRGDFFSRSFSCKRPIENGKPAFQARHAVDFIRRNKNNPFILHVSYLEPHPPYVSPLKKDYDAMEILDPENYTRRNENEDQQPWRVRIARKDFEKTKGFNGGAKARAEIARHYYGNISVVDRSVEKILAELERHNLSENTIVVFTSDHGEFLSSHGLWEKSFMYQEAMRVPMLIKAPGARGGTRVTAPWQHADLVPTILDLMGKKVPANLLGRNRAPEIRGQSMPAQTVFSEWTPNFGTDKPVAGQSDIVNAARARKAKADAAAKTRETDEGKPISSSSKGRKEGHDTSATLNKLNKHELAKYLAASSRVAISPDGWKLWLSDVDIPQLFNINEDPQELTNLYKEPQHRDRIKKMTAEIKTWQSTTNDQLSLTLE